MSATERLRELLDERGVEHEGDERSMRWRDRYGIMMQAFPLSNGELGMEVWSCTPEQAIAATLGPGTCCDLAETPDYRDKTEFKCSECGYEYSAVGGFGCDYGDEPDFNFCPNCGRRVVGE